MELILKALQEQSIIVIAALFGALVYGFKSYGTYITELLKFKKEQQQKVIALETDLLLENLKKDAQRESLLKDKALEHKLNRNTLKDGIRVIDTIAYLREHIDAFYITLNVFHNGIAKGFKNYSTRFQEARNAKRDLVSDYQAKPLASFYKEIDLFEKVDYVSYTRESKHIPKPISHYFQENEIDEVITFPILIEIDDSSNYNNDVVAIRKQNKDYTIVGTFTVLLDRYSNKVKMIDRIEDCLNKIISIYKENNNIFS